MSREVKRRDFLRLAAGASLAATTGAATALLEGCARLGPAPQAAAPGSPAGRKLIVVIFGGGTRSSEAVDDPEHRYIPRLWNEMVPRGALLTNARVEHLVVHPNGTGIPSIDELDDPQP